MGGGSGMAMLTGDAGLQGIKVNTIVGYCASRMTAETGRRFGVCKFAAKGLLERCRLHSLVADRNVEAVRQWIEADVALVEAAIAFEYPGLRAGSKCPLDGRRNCARAIANRIGALAVARLHGVRIAAVLERKLRMSR